MFLKQYQHVAVGQRSDAKCGFSYEYSYVIQRRDDLSSWLTYVYNDIVTNICKAMPSVNGLLVYYEKKFACIFLVDSD